MARMAATMEHDEDAEKLKLGPGVLLSHHAICARHTLSHSLSPHPDFANSNTLLNAEVALILEHKLNASQANSVQPKSIFLKSYEYVNRVKRLKNKEDVTTARGCVPTLPSRPIPTWDSPRAPQHTPPRQPQSKPNRPAPVADLSAWFVYPRP